MFNFGLVEWYEIRNKKEKISRKVYYECGYMWFLIYIDIIQRKYITSFCTKYMEENINPPSFLPPHFFLFRITRCLLLLFCIRRLLLLLCILFPSFLLCIPLPKREER